MRIRELFEGELLLENYRDFKSLWHKILMEVGAENDRDLVNIPMDLESMLKDNGLKSALQNDYDAMRVASDYGNRRPMDISAWIGWVGRMLSQGVSAGEVISRVDTVVEMMKEVRSRELASRTPKYGVVKKTNEFIVFDVKNFAAAKKLRNQVGSTWCIGASNDYFLQYGSEQGRNTYIIFLLKTRKGMVIHADRNRPHTDNLITSHSNDSEAYMVDGILNYRRGYGEIERDLDAALSPEGMTQMFESVGLRYKKAPRMSEESISKLEKLILKETGGLNQRFKRYRQVYDQGVTKATLNDLYDYIMTVGSDVAVGWPMGYDDAIENAKELMALIMHIRELEKARVVSSPVFKNTVETAIRLNRLVSSVEYGDSTLEKTQQAMVGHLQTVASYAKEIRKIANES